MEDAASSFTVMGTGQILSAEIPGCARAYCKFELSHGEDWQLLDGMEAGVTQLAHASTSFDRQLVWNFPLDFTYTSTNAFGWPQVVITVYAADVLGRDVIKGYGCIHIPTRAGKHELSIRLYRPRSSSLLQTFTSWLTGMPAEFADSKFPSYGEGREVTRVVSSGKVCVQLNVLTKDMDINGYQDGNGRSSASSFMAL